MTIKVNDKQYNALSNISFKQLRGVHHMTKKFLVENNLIEKSKFTGEWFITNRGAEVLGIELAKPSEQASIAREIQDEILAICEKHHVNMYLAVSQDMPSDIKVVDLYSVVYPDHIIQMRGTLHTLKTRFNKAN